MQIASNIKIKTIVNLMVAGGFLTLVFYWLLINTSLISPVVTIETERFPAQQSQIYYKHNESYNDTNSSIRKLDPATGKFEFTLPRYDDDLRWDPLETAGSFYVKSITTSLLGFSTKVDLKHATPLSQIEETKRTEKSVYFTAPAGAVDPQINIHIESNHLDKIRNLAIFVLPPFFALITLIWIYRHNQIFEFLQRETFILKSIKKHCKKEEFTLSEFIKLLSIGVFLNIFPIVNFFLSIDDELGAFRSNPSIWIEDGRWTAFLVEKFIFPQPVLPFVPNLFFYTFLALSYMLILRAHQLKLTYTTALAYGIFIAHPIWWFIGEFYSNIPTTGVGMLTLSFALYLFSKLEIDNLQFRSVAINCLIAIFTLSIAVGAYQSLAMFYLAGGIGVMILKFRQENTATALTLMPTLKRALFLAGILLSGVALYAIINKLAQLTLLSNRMYIDNFIRIDELIANPGGILKIVFREMLTTYTGSVETYGVSFLAAAILLSVASIFLITQNTWKSSFWMTLFVFSLLTTPFLLNFVAGGILPLRALLAVSYISWFTVIIVLENKGLVKAAGIAVTITLLFQIIYVNGQYSASTIMATTHDRLTAEALYARISQLDPNFDRDKEIKLDIYGKLSLTNKFPSPPSSTMNGSFFDWDEGNLYRMLRYMRLVGFSNVHAMPKIQRIGLTPNFEGMPVWPAAGSVRFENGVYLIKLGHTPDRVHAKYSQIKAQ